MSEVSPVTVGGTLPAPGCRLPRKVHPLHLPVLLTFDQFTLTAVPSCCSPARLQGLAGGLEPLPRDWLSQEPLSQGVHRCGYLACRGTPSTVAPFPCFVSFSPSGVGWGAGASTQGLAVAGTLITGGSPLRVLGMQRYTEHSRPIPMLHLVPHRTLLPLTCCTCTLRVWAAHLTVVEVVVVVAVAVVLVVVVVVVSE